MATARSTPQQKPNASASRIVTSPRCNVCCVEFAELDCSDTLTVTDWQLRLPDQIPAMVVLRMLE